MIENVVDFISIMELRKQFLLSIPHRDLCDNNHF